MSVTAFVLFVALSLATGSRTPATAAVITDTDGIFTEVVGLTAYYACRSQGYDGNWIGGLPHVYEKALHLHVQAWDSVSVSGEHYVFPFSEIRQITFVRSTTTFVWMGKRVGALIGVRIKRRDGSEVYCCCCCSLGAPPGKFEETDSNGKLVGQTTGVFNWLFHYDRLVDDHGRWIKDGKGHLLLLLSFNGRRRAQPGAPEEFEISPDDVDNIVFR